MRVVKDSMREFNKFISDEGLERILGRKFGNQPEYSGGVIQC